MRVRQFPTIPWSIWLLFYLIFLISIEGCSLNFTRYSDGPLTQYLGEPLPKTTEPIARSFNLERISFQTAANMKGMVISDFISRDFIYLPGNVGVEVKQTLQLDEKYDEKRTLEALNIIAKYRSKGKKSSPTNITMAQSSNTPSTNVDYIRRQESLARDAYKKGDYLKGNIHNSSAANAIAINQSFSQAQAAANLGFAVIGGLAAAGRAMIQTDFENLRNWIEKESGAIGNQAREDRHLSVFLLQFFDAESFQFDSRNRVAVYLVLSDKNGIVSSVLEGSDILICEDKCDLFKPKLSSKKIEDKNQSADVRKVLSDRKHIDYLLGNGFEAVSGLYHYILFRHALQKLAKSK